ncbi:MAG TPA: hypothetical protein VGQ62_14645, partial [Chloroflexota bacterium]|nr:hypothetical protein [Chloroflexota bacterium]
MASARVDDAERTVKLGLELVGVPDKPGPVCLLQCGEPSPIALELGRILNNHGRRTTSLVIKDREHAQADVALSKLLGASAVWVFADDLLDAFFTMFATDLAFVLRARTKQGMAVVGIGAGGLALGGLLLANKICAQTQYELVSGLGWAPRVLLDGGPLRYDEDRAIARMTARSLPGLLGVDLRQGGGIRVEGGRVESIGSEPISLFGAGNEEDTIVSMELDPGQVTIIAPPPFAPFEQRLLSPETIRALSADYSARRKSSTS